MKLKTYALCLLLSSCGTVNRTVDKQQERVRIIDRTVVETKKPGDVIVVDYPRSPNARPRDTVIEYRGNKGAVSRKTFDKSGYLVRDSISCPEEQETKRLNITTNADLKAKLTSRQVDLEVAKLKWGVAERVGKWFSVCFAIAAICVAMVRRLFL